MIFFKRHASFVARESKARPEEHGHMSRRDMHSTQSSNNSSSRKPISASSAGGGGGGGAAAALTEEEEAHQRQLRAFDILAEASASLFGVYSSEDEASRSSVSRSSSPALTAAHQLGSSGSLAAPGAGASSSSSALRAPAGLPTAMAPNNFKTGAPAGGGAPPRSPSRLTASAAPLPQRRAAGAEQGKQPAASPPPAQQQDDGEEPSYDRLAEQQQQQGEVICEVKDLYYAIELPPTATAAAPPPAPVAPALPPGKRRQTGYSFRGGALLKIFRKDKGAVARASAPAATRVESAAPVSSVLREKKRVLTQGVNCRFCAGDMVAVIGASGAGKSTFLDLLAGKKKEGECAGQILVTQSGGGGGGGGGGIGRWRRGGKGRGRPSVYVTQDDFHVAELTVRESLAFAVRLSMGGRERDRRARVEELLDVLGLRACAEVRVGNPLERGISGGEARRLSMGIGVAALESVRLLLLDEPTTGLDSSSAAEVMLLARKLASRRDRRVVVASVHQPSAEMFSLFDKVLVMVGGRQAFFGSASKAADVLSRPELGIMPTPGQNSAEFILLAAKAVLQSSQQQQEGRASRRGARSPEPSYASSSIHSSASTSPQGLIGVDPSSLLGVGDGGGGGGGSTMGGDYLFEDAEKGLFNEPPGGKPAAYGGKGGYAEEEGAEEGKEEGTTTLELLQRRPWGIGGWFEESSHAVGFWAQVSAVWGRGWTVQARRKDTLKALLFKNAFIGVLAATVFFQKGAVEKDAPLVDPLIEDVTPAASNVLGILYFGCLYGLTGHLQAIPEIFEWKRHFERERAGGMYSTTVYWLVSSTVHLPIILVGFLVYLNVCYWALGLPHEYAKFFIFSGIGLMSTLMGYSLAQTLSAAMSTPQNAFATWPLVFVTAANFSGFTVRLPAVRVWFSWLCNFSFCRWIYQLMAVNQFHDFDEGPKLLDLYFGTGRPTLLVNAVYVGLVYSTSLLLALFFLHPRRSRLKFLEEAPLEDAATAVAAQRQEQQQQQQSRDLGGGWSGEEVKETESVRKGSVDSSLLEAYGGGGDGDGPLYYLEEGGGKKPTQTFAAMTTSGAGGSLQSYDHNDASSLRVPLLGGFHGGFHSLENMGGVYEAGVCEGSRVAFSNLNYHVYLRDEDGSTGTTATTTASVGSGRSPGGGGGGGGGGGSGGGVNPAAGAAAGRGDVVKPAVVRRDESKREQQILRGVCGVVAPGQMMAIMGPSGSGKTTLLDLLGGRKTRSVGRQEGDIVVDGVFGREGGVVSRGSGVGGSAYVMQDNVHHASLTVRQTLQFAAKLRMSNTVTAEDREKRVAAMVTMLGLEGVLETTVGDESNRGISGGEAKRLSVAVEAIDLPGLLLLDEPTSGLDATTALEVLTAVRGLADLGRTVILSLHQPSGEMFELLDVCLLLAKGGYPAYFGRANRAMAYFASVGLTPPPSSASVTDQNPADFLLSLLAQSSPSSNNGTLTATASDDGDLHDRGSSLPTSSSSSPSRFSAGVDIAPTMAAAEAATEASSSTVGGGGLSPLLDVDLGIGHVGVEVGQGPSTPSRRGGGFPGIGGDDDAGCGGGGGGGYSGRRPVTPAELGRAFLQSSLSVGIRQEAEREAAEAGVRRRDAERMGLTVDGAETAGRGWRSMLWLSTVLTHRELVTTWQDKARIFQSLGRHAFVGAFYGALWWRLGVGRVYERVGVIFFSLVFVMLGNQQNIPRIFQDRLLFYREKGAGVYGAVEYWWSIVIAQIPLAVLTTATYGSFVYFMSGLNHNGWEPFGYFLLVIVLCNLVALSFCQMLAAGTRLQDTAVSLFPVFLFFFIAFGGMIVRLPTLPSYLHAWAPTISFVRWAMEGLVINEFEGNEDYIFPAPEDVPITPEQIYDSFLEAYGFGQRGNHSDVLGQVLWILVASLVMFRLLTLIGLKYITFERR